MIGKFLFKGEVRLYINIIIYGRPPLLVSALGFLHDTDSQVWPQCQAEMNNLLDRL